MVGESMMELNYFLADTEQAITLRPYYDFGDYTAANYFAVHHDGQDWYTPLCATTSSVASALRLRHNNATYALSTNPDLLFNSTNPAKATTCTMIADSADFSATKDGELLYQSMAYLRASRPNATIIAGANNCHFFPSGGEENVFTGLTGINYYQATNSDMLIVDFGSESSNKTTDGVNLPSKYPNDAINVFDSGTYYHAESVLEVQKTPTGLFFDMVTSNANSRKIAKLDIALTYIDKDDIERVVLMPNVIKHVVNYGDNFSCRYNTLTVQQMNIRVPAEEGSTSAVALTTAQKQELYHDWEEFPQSLRPKLLRLYQIYRASPYFCSFGSGETPQHLPDWIPQ